MLPDIQSELEHLRTLGLYRKVRQIETAQEPHIRINGHDLILFCSNNYLGLANHPALRGAAVEALNTYGSSTVASALISGYMRPHAELEQRMAQFLGTEAAIAFPTGYTANLGVITTLIGPDDIVFSDRLNHRSIIDGCRLSRAQIAVYDHCNTDHLRAELQKAKKYRRRLIVTDGVFSMDGDIAPLPELVTLTQQYEAILMVDDAHGTGVLGASGRGTFEHFDLSPNDIDIHMTSGSKALGASGGYISGSTDLIDLIRNRSASYIYTTSMPPDACASTTAALDLIDNTPEIRQNLWHNTETIRKSLQNLGFDLASSQTQIIPIVIGDAQKTVE
ncbi:MAG: 8-amino-7-oxononanoate synthase, partial [Candidatus Latescibacteria bacterium]|nr:8-amino-7-oxononanoate synthase [Candidatus Latescibacterota bacterium]